METMNKRLRQSFAPFQSKRINPMINRRTIQNRRDNERRVAGLNAMDEFDNLKRDVPLRNNRMIADWISRFEIARALHLKGN